jgi:ferritin-like metal-binding protein YciE
MDMEPRTGDFRCVGEGCAPDEGAKEGRQEGNGAQGPGGAGPQISTIPAAKGAAAGGEQQASSFITEETSMKTLNDLFLEELADMYDAESRIVKGLPMIAKAATCQDLKKIVQTHLKESEGHVKKLDQIFSLFGEDARKSTCEATVGLLKEAEEIAKSFAGSAAINSALICALQKIEHYELASYGCLHEWAVLLEESKAAGLLQDILDEEGAANRALTGLARSKSNEEALDDSAEMRHAAGAPGKKASGR